VHTKERTFHTRAVVGADGSQGIVRPWLAARERPPHVARLLELVVPAKGDEVEFRQGLARFDFTPAQNLLQGYLWDFPSLIAGEPFLNRGVYDARVDGSRGRAPLPGLLEAGMQARGQGHVRQPVQGHPIHWFAPRNRFSAPRVLLVGDAAGADPLFGEGIAVAIAYGRVAAASLRRAFARRDFSFRGYRGRLLASPLGRYLLLRWLAAGLCYRMSGSDLFMRGLWVVGRLLAEAIGPRMSPALSPPNPHTSPHDA
jgi:flavin-dependent dehydrogenase